MLVGMRRHLRERSPVVRSTWRDPDEADEPAAGALASRGPGQVDHVATPGGRWQDTTSRLVAALGLVIAVIALAVALRSALVAPASGCQTTAWNAVPAEGSLPSGWAIAASDFTPTGVTSTLSGPQASDGSGTPTTVYTTVSCFGNDASQAVERSRTAAAAAGQTVRSMNGLGDEAYSTTDAASGGMAIQFRRGTLVGYTAATESIPAGDLEAIATAFDDAMRSAEAGATLPPAGGSTDSGPSGSPGSGSPAAGTPDIPGSSPSSGAGASPSAAASAAAPELEALLPIAVNGTTLTRDSAVGSDVLGGATAGRALSAALRNLGADPKKLHVAEAYDASGTIDLSMLAFAIDGLDTKQLRSTILSVWLSAGGPGVKTSSATMSGHQATVVDYGDKGTISYVIVDGKAIVVIETSDSTLAKQAAAALH